MKKILKNLSENNIIIIRNIIDHYMLVIGVLIIGLLFGWVFFHSSGAETLVNPVAELNEEHKHGDEESTSWTCSMHPQIKQDKPGKCPICAMDLIPLSNLYLGDNVDPNQIVMSESAIKLASIQTIIVTRGVPEKTVYLQGKVQADERNIAELTARFGGRIEKLFINFTGQNVQKGEKLATIYSPGLVTAQRELLEAIAFKENRPSLYTAAKVKLKLWDLTDKQISSIEENGDPLVYFDILSPITGTVTMRHVAIGDYVKEGTALFKVVNLSNVWVMFDAYESDLPWIKTGDKVDFTIQALPGNSFTSKVTFIDPFINSKTRVARVRVEIPNQKLILKPEMFVAGLLESGIAKSSNEILVPKSSVLWTGKRAIVYVKVPDQKNPSFLYREVILGPEAGEFFVIAQGLLEGEEIASNGTFKIDAAAQLQGLPSMMNPDGGIGTTVHNHSGINMNSGNETKNPEESKEMDTNKTLKETDPRIRTQLTNVYTAYLKMKNAFVASDVTKVVAGSIEIGNAIKEVDMNLLKGKDHIIWMEQSSTLEKSLSTISKQSDLEKQRIEFALFNLTFYKLLKSFGLKDITTFYQFCPMANSDKGAYWFSDSEEIRNPYFGDMMLGCGENRETIE
jgi:membrane fusion protein, copper/silver efflux system